MGQHVLFMTSSNSTKSCFFWYIELTGFPNKNVKSRIGKRKSTSTETTFNSRAWHIENWKFLGDFITGSRVQASNSGFANVAFPLVRFSPSVESHQGKKVGEIENKHEQIQRVFNWFLMWMLESSMVAVKLRFVSIPFGIPGGSLFGFPSDPWLRWCPGNDVAK